MLDLELTYIKRGDGTRTMFIPEEQKAAAIAFCRAGGTKTAAEIEELVVAGHNGFIDAIDGLTEAQAAHKPSPEDWSFLELMGHVVSGKQIMGTLAAALAQGTLPPGFGPTIETEAAQDGITVTTFSTLADARAAAATAQAAMLAVIGTLDGQVDTERTFSHFYFGAFNSKEWCAFQRVHDDNHAQQSRAMRVSAGFPSA